MDETNPPAAPEIIPPGKPPSPFQRLRSWTKLHPRKAVITGIVTLVVLGGAGYLAGRYFWPKQPEPQSVQEQKEEVKKTKPSPLTGVELKPALADRPIRGVVIENSPEARPQSGLGSAGVVYESVSEGGITRYLALFLEGKPKTIGPVRSLRLFFMSWAREFGAPISHVGGNASAIDNLRKVGVVSLNQFFNSGYYYRSADRYAPHNVYTNTALLDRLYKAKGLFKPASFTPSLRKDDEPPADGKTVPHKRIKVRFSYGGFDVLWEYSLGGNDYKRYLAGVPDKDRNTGRQIRVKNVVAMYMPTSYGTSRNGEKMTVMQTVGTGKAILFRDGTAVRARWRKDSHADRTRFFDAEGKEIALNRGNSWYCVIPAGTGSVSY